MVIKIYASAYLRPSTREVFENIFSVISYSGDPAGTCESMDMYWSDYIWEEFKDLDPKSLYKFDAILNLKFTKYGNWWNEYSECDEEIYADTVLTLERASDFEELREVVTRILGKPERVVKFTDHGKLPDLVDLFKAMK